ncbi:hypothetical protein EJ03DRAFT_33139 [Teratosphaeria nubilosa]|uniref:Uncharacterized protein n=1 Tax=Teratosphaeria nubilosa TaxID=161662 RepID=A0A6G1KUN2_9PEZI|nr:hypothetical protein EJ03DRAFT_33139 [Teratosphaeria nubilosa]
MASPTSPCGCLLSPDGPRYCPSCYERKVQQSLALRSRELPTPPLPQPGFPRQSIEAGRLISLPEEPRSRTPLSPAAVALGNAFASEESPEAEFFPPTIYHCCRSKRRGSPQGPISSMAAATEQSLTRKASPDAPSTTVRSLQRPSTPDVGATDPSKSTPRVYSFMPVEFAQLSRNDTHAVSWQGDGGLGPQRRERESFAISADVRWA